MISWEARRDRYRKEGGERNGGRRRTGTAAGTGTDFGKRAARMTKLKKGAAVGFFFEARTTSYISSNCFRVEETNNDTQPAATAVDLSFAGTHETVT